MELARGGRFGDYEIVEPLGSSREAETFRATRVGTGRTVALKIFPRLYAQDASFLTRMRRDASTLAALRHPNIVSVLDYGEQDGLAYLALDFVEGGTLRRLLGLPVSLPDALRLLTPIAQALDYAHAHGIVHGDLKPEKVLLDEGVPRLTDFGLVQIIESSRLTQAGTLMGTPEYMSPEQATAADVGPGSDIYSLGVVSYEMLVGAVPFSAPTPMATILAHMHEEAPRPSQKNVALRTECDAVLLRALAKESEARFATASELVAALASIAHPTVVGGQPARANSATGQAEAAVAPLGSATSTTARASHESAAEPLTEPVLGETDAFTVGSAPTPLTAPLDGMPTAPATPAISAEPFQRVTPTGVTRGNAPGESQVAAAEGNQRTGSEVVAIALPILFVVLGIVIVVYFVAVRH